MTFMGIYDVGIFDCPPFRMFTAGDCPRAENILSDGSFEPESMRLWCRLARDATSILDIGAHVGVYSLAAAALRKDIPIHAFEPNPYAYARLRVHKRLNGFENIVEHTVALSNNTIISPFSWCVKPTQQISSGGSLGGGTDGMDTVPVWTRTLDSFEFDYGARPLVKIDVEGHEKRVLRCSSNMLAAKPDIILEGFDQAKCDAIMDMLPLGAKFYKIVERGWMDRTDRLIAASQSAPYDFNQFVTWRMELPT